ncbi:MAG TPA: sulfotransferase [Trueperaceae bacterium]
MSLRVVGAGPGRTGTYSLKLALEHLLGGSCYHMRELPGHPFDLGAGWRLALEGGTPDWDRMLGGYVAAVDWPASLFWRELSVANPDALVLLSVRDTALEWWQSIEETILPYARMSLAADWDGGRDFQAVLERFTGTPHWDDASTMMAAYERHNAEVRASIPPHQLLEWQAASGWEPICRALGLLVPSQVFPWSNRRSEWAR